MEGRDGRYEAMFWLRQRGVEEHSGISNLFQGKREGRKRRKEAKEQSAGEAGEERRQGMMMYQSYDYTRA